MVLKNIGIDLGTSNTIIYAKNRGIILREPTAVAFECESGDVIAAGARAKRMLDRVPQDKEVVLPLQRGVVSHFDDAVEMMLSFFDKLGIRGMFGHPNVAVSIPWGVTEVEKNAFENLCYEAGAKHVYPVVDAPMAAALGAGIDILKAKGNLVVDIGAGSTESAIISYRGIVRASMVRSAGDSFDEAIITYIKNNYNTLIGRPTAEHLKKTRASAHPDFDSGEEEVRGKNLLTGQVSVVTIHSAEVRDAIYDELIHISDTIRQTLEGVPPEIASDIYDNGMILMGGSALILGIDKFFEEQLGMPVQIAKHPLECVARGLGKIVDRPGELAEVVSARRGI